MYEGYPKPEQVNKIIGSVIENFYSDVDQPVVIDKNRAWTARVPYIEGYIKQQAKIIVPVRSIDEILTSMLTMIHRNPFQEGQARINFVDEQLVKNNIPINDTTRCYHLLNPGGIVHDSLDAIMRGFNENYKDRMHFVDYNNLETDQHRELDKIYEFLGEDPYEHTFTSLYNLNRENDLNTYGLSDMHNVRSVLKKTSESPSSVLPSEILELYYQSKDRLEFWGTPSIIKVQAPPTKENKVQMGTFLGTVI